MMDSNLEGHDWVYHLVLNWTMVSMPFYRMNISYAGTNYYGWQTQPNGKSVQDTIEKDLSIALKEKIKIKGASRTDSGVHALDQHATFHASAELDENKLFGSLCGLLPTDISIKSLAREDNDFDVINASYGKTYVYRVWNHRAPHPFLRPFVWHLKTQKLNEDRLKEALCLFEGKHNFEAYAAMDGSAKTFERNILEFELRVRDHLFEFWISGDGFLKQMIRNIVGTLTEYSKGKISYDAICESFEHGDRRKTGLCAPAEGLTLHKIFYDKPPEIRDLQNELAALAVIQI